MPEPVIPQKHALVVFLKGADAQKPDSILAMRREVQRLMEPAGYEVDFRTSLENVPVSGQLVVVEFKGLCLSGGAQAENAPQSIDLATTSVSDGHVLPFSQVHCSLVSHLLAPELQQFNPAQRDLLLGRSIGRVLAHELYHILADETEHTEAGVAKCSFSAADLLSANFQFEGTALRRMSKEPLFIASASR